MGAYSKMTFIDGLALAWSSIDPYGVVHSPECDREKFMMKGMVELISRIVSNAGDSSSQPMDLKPVVHCFAALDDWDLQVNRSRKPQLFPHWLHSYAPSQQAICVAPCD